MDQNIKLDKCKRFHPEGHQILGYVPIRPFECQLCSICGECIVDWPTWKSIAWSVLIGWWWDGRVRANMAE